jgi:nitrite reductase/ring-hydroxylating ferredoxin subunit
MLFWMDGQVRACSAICPHMGARLDVDTRRGIVTCPWHGLTARIGSSDVEGFSCAHPRYRRIRQFRITRDNRGNITLER